MKLILTSLVVAAGALFVTLSGPKDAFDKQAAALREAGSLQITFKAQKLPGEATECTLSYSKPNFFKIDSPKTLIESDGKTLWRLDKAANTYTEEPLTAKNLMTQSQSDEALAWAYFFGGDETLKNATNFGGGDSRTVRGNQVTEVTYTWGETHPKQVTLYVDDKLGVPRGATLKTEGGNWLVMASEIKVSKDALPADQFAFVAPEGAKKAETAPTTGGEVSYAAVVAPIFQAHCAGCHGASGGFSVANYDSVMAGGRGGAMVIAGDPDGSPLVQYLTGQRKPRMPKGGKLTDEDIQKVKDWIKAGAKP